MTYGDRVRQLRKIDAITCKGCGLEFDGTTRFFGYGDDAECESCMGEGGTIRLRQRAATFNAFGREAA